MGKNVTVKLIPTQIAPHFRNTEMACRCGCGEWRVSPILIQGLEAIRRATNSPIQVNSAKRCPTHNSAVGGSPSSRHLVGKAADIISAAFAAPKLAEIAEQVSYFRNGGVGLYYHSDPKGCFLHVDVRNSRARWGSINGKLCTFEEALEAFNSESTKVEEVPESTPIAEKIVKEEVAKIIEAAANVAPPAPAPTAGRYSARAK